MVLRVRKRIARSRVPVALAAFAAAGALGGCGALNRAGAQSARADAAADMAATCPAVALQTLGKIATRVYREGVQSERTAVALRLIGASQPLRAAVESGDRAKAREAALALVATGHLTDLKVVRGSTVLAEVGDAAVAPLHGTLTGAGGKPLARFTTSVWSDGGLLAETSGITEGIAVLRERDRSGAGRTIAGALQLPSGRLGTQGTLSRGQTTYAYTSQPVAAYPSGRPLREYVLRTVGSLSGLCGRDASETTVNTLSRIARLIYAGEAGARTGPLVDRVQSDRPLLSAVARRDPRATRAAVVALLHHHIVRLRISAGGRVLADVGGPYVLAPVAAPLRLGASTIGSLLLSIQDDEGYKRLAQRLVGLDVLMYMGGRLVKSTVGLSPGAVPTRGSFAYRGRSYRAYTFYARAFPSGPLRITVLIPIPYA